jgi:hypothetical protein
MSQIHYLPLTPGFFAILVGIFVIVLILRSVRFGPGSRKKPKSAQVGGFDDACPLQQRF